MVWIKAAVMHIIASLLLTDSLARQAGSGRMLEATRELGDGLRPEFRVRTASELQGGEKTQE